MLGLDRQPTQALARPLIAKHVRHHPGYCLAIRWQKTRDTIAADILEKAMTPDERRSCNIMGEEGWMRVCYSFRRPDYFQQRTDESETPFRQSKISFWETDSSCGIQLRIQTMVSRAEKGHFWPAVLGLRTRTRSAGVSERTSSCLKGC